MALSSRGRPTSFPPPPRRRALILFFPRKRSPSVHPFDSRTRVKFAHGVFFLFFFFFFRFRPRGRKTRTKGSWRARARATIESVHFQGAHITHTSYTCARVHTLTRDGAARRLDQRRARCSKEASWWCLRRETERGRQRERTIVMRRFGKFRRGVDRFRRRSKRIS